MLTFFDVISISATHIYISALPLSPHTSIVYELYKKYAHPLVRVIQGLPTSWGPALATSYREGREPAAVWSPCSRFIAITGYTIIDILDATTLEQLNTFKSQEGDQKLSFSPDGHTLIQFDQEKLSSWDLQTGAPVNTIFYARRQEITYQNPFSVAYSMDEQILVVLNDIHSGPTYIDTYDLFSGTHIYSYHPPEGHIVTPVWTHGECFRFVTVKPRSIMMWETTFASVHTLEMIQSFPVPEKITDMENEEFLFLPPLSQLAFTANDTICIWDAQGSRFLLKYGPPPFGKSFEGMSFSSDGHFFLHTASRKEIYVWKKTFASYTLHQRFASPSVGVRLLLSPNEESIVATSPLAIHQWPMRDQILSPSVPTDEDSGQFILRFSPNKVLAAFARYQGNVVTILDLKSGNLQLIIDAGVDIDCLQVTETTVIVVGEEKVITWKLPTECHIKARVNIDDSVHTVMLESTTLSVASISPDLSRVAIVVDRNVQVHDTSTGGQLVGTEVTGGVACIALGDYEVWITDLEDPARGWKIIEGGESSINKLESLTTTTCPPQVFPWQSHCGYEVTDDGWVLSPTQRPLMWLPHHWRSEEEYRVWGGQFLGLGHGGLPEVVVLEFFD